MQRQSIAKLLWILFLCATGTDARGGYDLSIKSPFFQPTDGDFQFTWQMFAHQVASSRLELPAQTIANTNFPQSTLRQEFNESQTALYLKYALNSSWIIGAGAKMNFRFNESIAGTGFLSSQSRDTATSTGILESEITLTKRWIGQEKGEFILDSELAFLPGIADSNYPAYSVPNHSGRVRLLSGINFESLAVGLLTSGQYWAKSGSDILDRKNNRLLAFALAFAQYDFEDFSLRFSGGLLKYLDSISAASELNKKPLGAYLVDIFFPLGHQTVFKLEYFALLSTETPTTLGLLKGYAYFEGQTQYTATVSTIF